MGYLLDLFDKHLLIVFNKDIKNPLADSLFPIITRLGELVVILPVCLLILFLDRKKGKRVVVLVAVAYLLSRTVTLALKFLTHRPRPFLVYEDLYVLGTTPPFHSFPSAHVALITAVSFVLGSKYENWQWFLWIAVTLVAVSRMYMGLHYPTDVAAGTLIGLSIGYLTNYMETAFSQRKKKGS